MQEAFQLNIFNYQYNISVRIDWLYFKPHLTLLDVPTPKQTWLAPPGYSLFTNPKIAVKMLSW